VSKVTIDRRLSATRLEGKSSLFMELIADCYPPEARKGSRGESLSTAAKDQGIAGFSRTMEYDFSNAGERPRIWRAKCLISRLQADA
jgi:hypothetical protein